MLNLILKDLLIQKKMILLSGVYIVVMLLAFQGASGPNAGTAVFSASMVAVTYILVTNVSAYDDKSKADIVLNSMPVNRRQIVASRYLSVYVFFVIAVVYYLLVTGIIKAAHLPVRAHSLSAESLIGAAFAVTLMQSVYLPVFFKLGYIKSKMVSLILFFVFFFGVHVIADAVNSNRSGALVKPLLEFVAGQPAALLSVGFAALIIVMPAVSYLISSKIYLNREF